MDRSCNHSDPLNILSFQAFCSEPEMYYFLSDYINGIDEEINNFYCLKQNWEKLEPLLENLQDEEEFDSFLSYISDPKSVAWEYEDPERKQTILHILLIKNFFTQTEKVINIIKNITTPDAFLKFINHKNYKEMNALHFACYKCDMNLIKLFIDNGIDPKAKTLIGLNYLHIAAQRNKVSIFYFILNKFKIDLYETDNNGNYFLHWACHYANDRIIDFFLNDTSVFCKSFLISKYIVLVV